MRWRFWPRFIAKINQKKCNVEYNQLPVVFLCYGEKLEWFWTRKKE
jgi:hypothetical protein